MTWDKTQRVARNVQNLVLDPEGFVHSILAGVAARVLGMQRALWKQSTGISADLNGLSSVWPPLGMPGSTPIDSHCIPSHALDRVRPTAAWFPCGNAQLLLVRCVLRCLPACCASSAILSVWKPRAQPVSLFNSPFPYSSGPTFDEFGNGEFEGLQWRSPDRLRQTGGLVHVTQFSSDPCRPFRFGHCCA